MNVREFNQLRRDLRRFRNFMIIWLSMIIILLVTLIILIPNNYKSIALHFISDSNFLAAF